MRDDSKFIRTARRAAPSPSGNSANSFKTPFTVEHDRAGTDTVDVVEVVDVVDVVDDVGGVVVLVLLDDVEDVDASRSHSRMRSMIVIRSDEPKMAPGFIAETMQRMVVGDKPSVGERSPSSLMRAVPSSESDVHEGAMSTEAVTAPQRTERMMVDMRPMEGVRD